MEVSVNTEICSEDAQVMLKKLTEMSVTQLLVFARPKKIPVDRLSKTAADLLKLFTPNTSDVFTLGRVRPAA